jgi:hypothetical protein
MGCYVLRIVVWSVPLLSLSSYIHMTLYKSKAIPVTGREDP